ncbi:MAG: hypothetical protein KIT14_08200 [bacterium]|nr:hypothetical protein [bacterium]
MRRGACDAGLGGRLVVGIVWLAGAAAALAAEATVVQFVPQGTVKTPRQVTARFSAPMVPFGDPRAAAPPFTVDCPEAGSGRWIDPRTWVYDFERDVPAGLRCTFTRRDDLATLAGDPVGGEATFGFDTGGPAVRRATPDDGDTIVEDQAFVLLLDAAVDPASVPEHVSFAIEGLPERVPAKVVDASERDAILAALWEWQKDGPTVVVASPQRFPNDARVELHWDAGVRTTDGVPTTSPQTYSWKVRPRFTAEFRCARENADRGCVPLLPMELRFSAPVARAMAAQIALIGPDGARIAPEARDDDAATTTGVTFAGPFPAAATFRVELPADVRDDAGRALVNADSFPLTVKTDPYPPLAKFSSRFGILEWKGDPTLPVTVRDLEPGAGGQSLRVRGNVAKIPAEDPAAMIHWLRRVAVAPRDASVFGKTPPPGLDAFKLPRVHGDQAFEVIGIPLASPGLWVVELQSRRLGASLLGRDVPFFVPTAALVTNLSAHLKWGRERSLVWVTTLESATPVENARVTVHDCHGNTLARGTTDARGVADVPLPQWPEVPSCHEERFQVPEEFFDWSQIRAIDDLGGGLFVVARTDDDMTFVHSSWDEGIEPYRFDLPSEPWTGPALVHTILDRALFRAGETVHMKHLLRERTLAGFGAVAAADRPITLRIRNTGTMETWEQSLAWNERGAAESTWTIPKTAKLGSYAVSLVTRAKPGEPWTARELEGASFRVEEFRVPLMQATLQLPAVPLVAPKKVSAEVAVRWLAGGAAGKVPVRVRAEERPAGFEPPADAGDYRFAEGTVRTGIERSGTGIANEEDGAPAHDGLRQLPRQDLVLDGTGTTRARLRLGRPAPTPRELTVELEYRDPSGVAHTVSRSVPLWPGDWIPGIAAERWILSEGDLHVKSLVLDVEKKPVAGAKVVFTVFDRTTFTTRKRVVGGFYAYENVSEVRHVGPLCEAPTDAQGRAECSGRPDVKGTAIVEASVTDPDGHTVSTYTYVYVSAERPHWFEPGDADRIDVVPERRKWEPGETARFQVRMPFQKATALVTVEREGVGDTWVVPITAEKPVVEVPITGAHAPNVFVSVLVVRGRVGDVQPTAMVDLGRPAFKLGITGIDVGWKTHTLDVAVASDRPVYRVRDTAKVAVAVRNADGTAPGPDAEVAIAAVDEGLLALAPNPTWKVLDAMMARRGYAVRTATAQMQVIGKRHYGKKAVAGGGGGGRQSTRELFDTLLLWAARVPLDADGRATVEVPINDSLTAFRIVAVATAGLGRFGTGVTTIRTTQDLMVVPGLAPLVREGDATRAEFTVRNTTERPITAVVAATVEGLGATLPEQTVPLAAGEAKLVAWDFTVPSDVARLEWTVGVREGDGASDRVKVGQDVRPAVPVRVLQATLFQWTPGAPPLPLARPADAIPGRGGIDVVLAPSLVAGLDGAEAWLRAYPYGCLEQRVSRAIGLGDDQVWAQVTATMPAHQDGDGLLKYFPNMDQGSEVLTAYVLAIADAAGRPLPDGVRDAALEGLRGFVRGTLQRPSRMADLVLRKLAAVEALARYGKAEPEQLDGIVVEPELWPTSAALDWWSILRRVDGVPDRAKRLAAVENAVRARLDLSGTTLRFSTGGDDALWWLMTGPEANGGRLLLLLVEGDLWREDTPRVVRGLLAMQQRGAWATTTANAWGSVAVRRFAAAYERTPVGGTTAATLGTASEELAWTASPAGGTLAFPWPDAPSTLSVAQHGTGAPWVTVQSKAAIPLREPLASGYRITKSVSAVEVAEAGTWHTGDVARVRLELDAQGDMGWVVVDDPIPAGASHVGTGLGGDSAMLAAQGADVNAEEPTFVERGFAGWRGYWAWLPKGRTVVEYVVRLGQPGTFQLPPTRAEAMYAPELFGEIPNPPWVVR